MARRELVLYPDPRLRQPTEKVSVFDTSLHKLLDDMSQTMYASRGIGLAAPQIGEALRITVVDISEDKTERLELINPIITDSSGEISFEEGCLSIPEYRDTVVRKELITVTAQNRHGEPFQIEAEGLLAICLQHEIDHLEGILFIDRLSRIRRDMFKRWFKKRLKDEE